MEDEYEEEVDKKEKKVREYEEEECQEEVR